MSPFNDHDHDDDGSAIIINQIDSGNMLPTLSMKSMKKTGLDISRRLLFNRDIRV